MSKNRSLFLTWKMKFSRESESRWKDNRMGPRSSLRLRWPCGCGKGRGPNLKGYTPDERLHLEQFSGIIGEREGFPLIRAVLIRAKRSGDCDTAAFPCPFGPEPSYVITHGAMSGLRVSHCTASCSPDLSYFLEVIDPETLWMVQPPAADGDDGGEGDD